MPYEFNKATDSSFAIMNLMDSKHKPQQFSTFRMFPLFVSHPPRLEIQKCSGRQPENQQKAVRGAKKKEDAEIIWRKKIMLKVLLRK